MNTPADRILATLRREFSRYRIWLEPGYGQCRFAARRGPPPAPRRWPAQGHHE